MTNGKLPGFDLARLSYGDLRRLQKIDAAAPDGLDELDAILARAVVGGLDAIPITEITNTFRALMAAMTEAMSGTAGPAALSLPDSDAAAPEVTST